MKNSMRHYIQQLISRNSLSVVECHEIIDAVMHDEVDPVQTAAILALIAAKGETAEEIYGFMQAIKNYSTMCAHQGNFLDIVGTGGDAMNTVNISTAASIVAASCGVAVIKHGNRAVSSQCGSADVLEQFGITMNLDSQQIKHCVNEIGLGFCYAPLYHPTFKKIKPIRTALGIRTLFNYLGPLLNPFSVSYYVLGVSQLSDLALMADVLMLMKVKRAMVVCGSGMDELNLLGPVQAIEISNGSQKQIIIDGKDFNFDYCKISDLQGGDAKTNARLIMDAFRDKRGPLLDTILLNAAVGLFVAEKANTIAEGVDIVRTAVMQNKPMEKLHQWIKYCSGVKHA